MKKSNKMIVEYHYIEPKTEAERIEAERRVNAVYHILFCELLRRHGEELSLGTADLSKSSSKLFDDCAKLEYEESLKVKK